MAATATRYCVIQNTPNAVTSAGMMTAPIVPVQPNFDIAMYSGTTPSCTGTAIVAITATSSGPDPLKRSFANAKPARVDRKTVVVAVTVDTTRELTSAFQKCTDGLLMASRAFAKKFPPGHHDRCWIVDGRLVARTDQERPVEGEHRADENNRQQRVDDGRRATDSDD